tara:strand:+ start:2145 stop:3089 length:945 start_codon:yes stop_codon:yes gene_type:complete
MKLKKPNFWDFKKPKLISYFLLPFTLPVLINNIILKFNIPKKNPKIKSICVGNIYLGGTGKTPTVIRLFEILNELNLKVITGKKFYKSHDDEKIILQKNTKLISAENRKKIFEKAIEDEEKIIIFDDGLQDPNVNYDLKFVCFDSINFIGNGQLIPSGPLREKINSLKKYDGVFLKGEKDISSDKLKFLKKINPNLEIFETFLDIKNLNKFSTNDRYLIFSGIGNPQSFRNVLINYNFNIIEEIIFPDHHKYSKNEIENIKFKAKKLNAKIITTEKDFVKITNFETSNIDFIEVKLKIKNEKNLINFINSKIHE